ncbi:replication protein C, IncQ-type [Aeromonas caviae]
MAELAAVGWTVSEYAKGKWEVKRPAAPTVTLPNPRRNSPQPPA